MIILGIDLGGTSAKCGLVSGGRIIRSANCQTDKDSNYAKILSDITALCQGLMTDELKPVGMGIGSPGLIDAKRGTVCWSNNIRWKERSLKTDLERELGLDAFIANDAKCAALGEGVYGAGKKRHSSLMLTIGTGVGGGVVRGGRLLSGNMHENADSIFGHITVQAGGRPCNCGRRGCLEAYASASALERDALSATGTPYTGKEIFELYRAGDRKILPVVDEFIYYLGVGAASLANALRPEVIIIGGGVSDASDVILPKLNEILEKEVYGFAYAPVTAVRAVLGSTAGIVGAAALYKGAIEHHEENRV